jgi:hypothetical protein
MTIQHNPGLSWGLFHEKGVVDPIHPEDVICFDAEGDAVEICRTRNGKKLKAAGSHWGLSTAAISDEIFIETNCPDESTSHPRLSGPAGDLVDISSQQLVDWMVDNPPVRAEAAQSDPCLAYRFGPYFVHLLAGTRVYEAYQMLDRQVLPGAEDGIVKVLGDRIAERGGPANAYHGPWAFRTLGGAAGQTLFGALTTGTHGGDYVQRPIADFVAALHLVTDQGRQFWIEPGPERFPCPIGDDEKLRAKYPPTPHPDGPIPLTIVRDSTIFDAVVVSVGRFGIVTSLVYAVVPQYALLEHRDLGDWSQVKATLLGPATHHAFDGIYFDPMDLADKVDDFQDRFGTPVEAIRNRFLQIAINVSPHGHNEHRCGVTQRWFVPHGYPETIDEDGDLAGRRERGTPRPDGSGPSFPFNPPPAPGDISLPKFIKEARGSGTMIQRACANANFISGLLRALADEIQKIIDNGYVPLGSPLLAALGVGAGGGIIGAAAGLCAALAAAVVLLQALADAIDAIGDISLADAAHTIANEILTSPLLPEPLKLMLLRCILLQLFESQQAYQDFVALSYAVMDTHDYNDRSCYNGAASIEVFFDASRPDIYCAYVDQILAFEGAQQVNEGKITVGYVSLRYVLGSSSLIAPARFPETVVMEVAEIRHADTSFPFVENAANVARNPMFAAPFHWGQRNPLGQSEVRGIFNAAPKIGALKQWQQALRFILKDCPDQDAFSSAFTIQTGLEP